MQADMLIVDVSVLPPRERHPKVFGAWNSLGQGDAMLLVNDHDPVPLYYQFAAEHAGGFHWDYVERGPELWKVKLSKGGYAHPGFVPGQRAQSAATQTPAAAAPSPRVLDVRPIFAQGGSPCSAIDEAVASLATGQSFVLLVPFEPVPLFGKLAARGLSHRSEVQADGSYRIEFTPGGAVQPDAANDKIGSCCGGH